MVAQAPKKRRSLERVLRKNRRAAAEATTREDIALLMQSLKEQGIGGDVPAAGLYLKYAIGQPTQPIELAGKDGGPIRHEISAVTRATKDPETLDLLSRINERMAIRTPLDGE